LASRVGSRAPPFGVWVLDLGVIKGIRFGGWGVDLGFGVLGLGPTRSEREDRWRDLAVERCLVERGQREVQHLVGSEEGSYLRLIDFCITQL